MKQIEYTIAIPVFERTEYFTEALKSAINQTVKCKVLVVDNWSSHNKFEEIISLFPDADIKFVRNSRNLGFVGNWNRCIELCETKYVTILHDDDLLQPRFIECIQRIESDWNVLFTKSIVRKKLPNDFLNINTTFSYSTPKTVDPNSFLYGNFNYAPGTVFSVEKAKSVGCFSSEFGPILDFHFWILISGLGKAYYINIPLSFYRISDSQATQVLFKEMLKYTYMIMQLIPDFRNKPILRTLSSFRIYCGGMDIYLRSGSDIKAIDTEFSENPDFLADNQRFYMIYKLYPLKKIVLEFTNFLMYLRINYHF